MSELTQQAPSERHLATPRCLTLAHLIHFDQVGFVSTREARDNTTPALDLIHRVFCSRTPSLIFLTDVEKAFDRVNWLFIEETLKHLGLGSRMVAGIMALYTSPSAAVVVNGHLSERFTLSIGTRQGCPLSPLIFILKLKPL